MTALRFCMSHKTHSFDTGAFFFAIKFLAVIAVLFTGVRYGTALASDRIIASGTPDISSVEAQLEQVKERRATQPQGANEVLEKLKEYESELSTRTIGTASIDTIAQAHEQMIAADLTNMKLYLFVNGHATATLDILSKGKRGSRWETPTGLYKIETKEDTHLSTIGGVYMPYSMQFFGNFFIHGWPYYPDGTPVPEGYSGGCIRLSTEDAQKVYEFAGRGMPIFVWEGDEATSTPLAVSDVKLPKVSAKAFLIADIHSGTVYAEHNADQALPIASISKLLTALVANETIHYDRTLTVTKDDRKQTEGTPGSIAPGDTFTVGELFYPLLMESNNSAAYSLARYNGMDNFVGWMNDKAKAIGMENTHMEDPSGLSPENKASANDLFKLTRYIAQNQSFILNLSREPQKTMKAENGRTYTFGNFNVFTGNPQFLGGKVGYTDEARETMTTVWELPIENATATISIVVLGSEDRKKDIDALLKWFKKAAKVQAAD
jgi:lipoprotein-anchoring transpeptidase ErfK/SrfK